MRYLIIDTEAKGNIIATEYQSEFEIDGRILTEEESLAKFREVFDSGRMTELQNHQDIQHQKYSKRVLSDFEYYAKNNL